MSRVLPKISPRVTAKNGFHTSAVASKDKLDLSFNDHE